jgi:hypothetical protein
MPFNNMKSLDNSFTIRVLYQQKDQLALPSVIKGWPTVQRIGLSQRCRNNGQAAPTLQCHLAGKYRQRNPSQFDESQKIPLADVMPGPRSEARTELMVCTFKWTAAFRLDSPDRQPLGDVRTAPLGRHQERHRNAPQSA